MSESFTIHGTWDSVPVDYTRTYAGDKGDNQEGEYMQPDDLVGAKALLEGMGWTFPSLAPAQPVQQQAQQRQQQQQQPFGGSSNNQMSWQCPVHGMTKVKTGYQGRGFECGVTTSGQQPQYPTRQWQGRQGETMYTCAMKSN